MQVQRIQNDVNYNKPSFGIKVLHGLKDMAGAFYIDNNKSQKQFNRFFRKYKYMQEKYGFNDYTIVAEQFYLKGKPKYGLYAVSDDPDKKAITLSVKDTKKQILEKFCHINEYELSVKIKE